MATLVASSCLPSGGNEPVVETMADVENNAASSLDQSAEKRSGKKSKFSARLQTASNFHRVVEQVDKEPMAIIVFKWLLILVGVGMLCVVFFFMGEVIYLWSTGDLAQQKMWTVGNFTAKLNKSREDTASLDSDIGF